MFLTKKKTMEKKRCIKKIISIVLFCWIIFFSSCYQSLFFNFLSLCFEWFEFFFRNDWNEIRQRHLSVILFFEILFFRNFCHDLHNFIKKFFDQRYIFNFLVFFNNHHAILFTLFNKAIFIINFINLKTLFAKNIFHIQIVIEIDIFFYEIHKNSQRNNIFIYNFFNRDENLLIVCSTFLNRFIEKIWIIDTIKIII